MTYSRAIIWTPRKTHKLWDPRPPSWRPEGEEIAPSARAGKRSFHPKVNGEWSQPPLPSWGKKKEAEAEPETTAEELNDRSAELRQQAEGLTGNAPTPSVRIQLGQMLLSMDSKAFEIMLKKWDTKGKGEVRCLRWQHCLPSSARSIARTAATRIPNPTAAYIHTNPTSLTSQTQPHSPRMPTTY